MNAISKWLESGEMDYQDGLQLLEKYGKNRQLIRFLGNKENSQNRKKLEYELNKIKHLAGEEIEDNFLENLNSQLNAAAAGDKSGLKDLASGGLVEDTLKVAGNLTRQIIPEASETPAPVSDGSYDALIKEMDQLYKERCQLSNSLAECNTDEEGEKVTAAVLAKQEAYNALAVKKQYFDDNGRFPEEVTPAVVSEDAKAAKDALVAQRTKLSPNVTKARKAWEKDPSNVLKEQKFIMLKADLDQLNSQIKMLS